MYQLQVRFDRGLKRVNTFYWESETHSIHCRLMVASASEERVTIALRFRGKAKAVGLVHVHPITGEMFQTEMAKLHEKLPRLELLLVGVPPDVSAELIAL